MLTPPWGDGGYGVNITYLGINVKMPPPQSRPFLGKVRSQAAERQGLEAAGGGVGAGYYLKKLNTLAYELYELTEEEIGIVEGGLDHE